MGKKIVTIMICLLSLIIFLLASETFGQSSRKVLMIPREGYSSDMDRMIKMEVGEMKRVLKEAGIDVVIATTSGQAILGPTQFIYEVTKLSEINLKDYVGIILPCMSVGIFPGPPVSAEAVSAVKKALADGKPVAAANGSVIVLAEAGALKGKKYSFFIDPFNTESLTRWAVKEDHRFDGAIYSGRGVVQDGKIITCGSNPYIEYNHAVPSGTVELTQKFIEAMGSR